MLIFPRIGESGEVRYHKCSPLCEQRRYKFLSQKESTEIIILADHSLVLSPSTRENLSSKLSFRTYHLSSPPLTCQCHKHSPQKHQPAKLSIHNLTLESRGHVLQHLASSYSLPSQPKSPQWGPSQCIGLQTEPILSVTTATWNRWGIVNTIW